MASMTVTERIDIARHGNFKSKLHRGLINDRFDINVGLLVCHNRTIGIAVSVTFALFAICEAVPMTAMPMATILLTVPMTAMPMATMPVTVPMTAMPMTFSCYSMLLPSGKLGTQVV